MATHIDVTASDAPVADSEPWPSPARAWYAIFIFALALMMNFLDRGIVGLLVAPIEKDLHLTDSEIGLVTGLAYILFYAVIGLPIARFADIGTRRTIVGIGVAVWSIATAFCGLAQNFWQLALARMGVGAGEACNGPPVFSMISDLFPRDKLPLAIAVLNFGFIAGNGIASIAGGSVVAALEHTPPTEVPFLGPVLWWQMVFIAVGLPGLIVAALMFTVKEPRRRGRVAKDGKHVGVPIREVARFFGRNVGTYLPMFAGLAFNVIPFVGLLIWGPTFFARSYGWSPAYFGIISGVITIIVAPFGAIFGGWLAGHLQRKGRDDANLIVVLVSFVLNTFGVLAFTLAPTPELSLAAFAFVQFVAMWVPGPFNAALQVVTPNEMRSQITALFLFIFNIIGFGLGPSVVPEVTARVFADPARIGDGLALTIAVLCPLAALSIWVGMKPYARAFARAKSWG
jgi:MFS family permease